MRILRLVFLALVLLSVAMPLTGCGDSGAGGAGILSGSGK